MGLGWVKVAQDSPALEAARVVAGDRMFETLCARIAFCIKVVRDRPEPESITVALASVARDFEWPEMLAVEFASYCNLYLFERNKLFCSDGDDSLLKRDLYEPNSCSA